MTKMVFALHGSDLDARLHEPALRERLRAAGGTRLQVNADDAHVTQAPLRFGPGTPITAVVSVWTDSQPTELPADLVAAVRDIDPTADGWLVEERLPLPPPEVADGVRADALANLAFLRRPESMASDDWLADWLGRHTSVAIETQGTFGYVQNPVVERIVGTASGDIPDVAGIVEELFPTAAMTDSHAFYGSGGDDAELQRRFTRLMASVARFGADKDLDLVPTSRYVWTL